MPVLSRTQSTKSLINGVWLLSKLFCYMSHMDSGYNDFFNYFYMMIVFEVYILNRGAVWSCWCAPMGQLQHRALGFWSNVIPFFLYNYTMEQQRWKAFHGPSNYLVTWDHPTQVISDLPRYNLGHAQQHST